MASAMRPAPTKPTRLQPDSSTAAAITPPRRAPPHPPHSAAPMGCEGLTELVHWLRRPHAPPSPGVSVRGAGRCEGRGGTPRKASDTQAGCCTWVLHWCVNFASSNLRGSIYKRRVGKGGGCCEMGSLAGPMGKH